MNAAELSFSRPKEYRLSMFPHASDLLKATFQCRSRSLDTVSGMREKELVHETSAFLSWALKGSQLD